MVFRFHLHVMQGETDNKCLHMQTLCTHRLWDAIPQRFIGPPSLRVLHAWNVPLASTLSTVVHQLRLRPSTLTDGQSGKPASVTHVWIEFVVRASHMYCPNSSSCAAVDG